jgi:diguanylate cyclase (GGDEF)-like protein/putative nucleotidyltransferase with HDIG domain
MRHSRLSRIGVKLVIAVVTILVIQVAVRSYVEFEADARNFRQSFMQAGRAHALSVAQGAEYGLLTGDKGELERVADGRRTAADADLLYVAFYDGAGRLLAARDWDGTPGLIPDSVLATREPRVTPAAARGEKFYRFAVPVTVSRKVIDDGFGMAAASAPSDGEQALIVTARSYEPVKERIAEAQKNMLLVSGLLLGAAVLVVTAISRRLVWPIRRLVEGTERVAEGDLDTRVDVGHRRDELGLLARSFNRMTDQLQGQRDQIVGYSQKLEEKVAARTSELAEANTRLQAANRQLAQLATTDELTGLWNRRRFIETLRRECRRAARSGASLALAMVDVDRFKAVNDTFGHAFGDRVLQAIAAHLGREARETDIVARYGGEEFMVLMPDTSAEEAFSAAERIRRRVAAHPVADEKRSVEVSISIGISGSSPARRADPEVLVRLADETLYAAKQAGRNCTRTWTEIARDQEHEVADRTEDVVDLERRMASLSLRAKDAFVQSIHGLVQALEARDPYTRHHSDNVTRYAVAIAEQMGLDGEDVAVVRRASRVHDIGKIGVPDALLRKQGELDDRQRRVMRNHVLIGVHILEQLRFLERELPLVRHHHERWDGKGYPDGISGHAIPRGARILAVADAFDALTSDRPYRRAVEVAEALRVLIEGAGTQFDAEVVDALVACVRAAGEEAGKESDLTPQDLLARSDPSCSGTAV